MTAATIIQLALWLTQTVLTQVKGTDVEQQVLADVQAAVDALAKVHGTDVTYEQLESLRVKPTW
jgi:hypothetical protein